MRNRNGNPYLMKVEIFIRNKKKSVKIIWTIYQFVRAIQHQKLFGFFSRPTDKYEYIHNLKVSSSDNRNSWMFGLFPPSVKEANTQLMYSNKHVFPSPTTPTTTTTKHLILLFLAFFNHESKRHTDGYAFIQLTQKIHHWTTLTYSAFFLQVQWDV